MDSDLAKQQLAFKKTLQNQPTIKRHLVSNSQTFSEKNKTLATTEGSSLKSSESSIESVADEFRFDSTDIRHVNSYVHAIISLLKTADRKMTFAEIKDRLNFDLETHEEVLEKVCRNERISYDAGQLSYKHLYDVRNEADLIKTLREHVEIGGILVQDLRQSFPKIDEYLQAKTQTKEILAFRSKDEVPKVIFFNQCIPDYSIDERFKSLWSSQTVPDAAELAKELEKAGLKGMEEIDGGLGGRQAPPAAAKKKTAKRNNRRIKITNTHIEGLDFSIPP